MSPQIKPFSRQPFSSLPDKPSRPHPFFSATAHDVTLPTSPFGPLRIHYREYGSGPPLLLVHGLMTTSYSWRYVLTGLGAHFRLIMPDLPGAGRSDKPDVPLAQEKLAAWIGDFQEALGIRGCAAVGNSLGGYLCMRHALRTPQAFCRLVNIHSPAFPIGRLYALQAALSIPGAQSVLRFLINRSPLKWAHRNVHYYDETLKSLEEAREYGAPLSTPEGLAAFASYLRTTMAPQSFAEFIGQLQRQKAEARAFPMPLLLLYSRQDPLVPPATGERLAALLPDAKLVWLDDSSHFAHVDSPDRVVPILLDFLKK